MRVGLARGDRLRVVLVWIGMIRRGVLLALVYCCWINWVNSLSRIGDAGALGWRGQLGRAGLICHRGIRACCGPVSKQGYPISCWAVTDLAHHTRLGERRVDHRVRTMAVRGSCGGAAVVAHSWDRRRASGRARREQRQHESHDEDNPGNERSTDHEVSAGWSWPWRTGRAGLSWVRPGPSVRLISPSRWSDG
jgi:hypothetical protein